MSRRRRDDGRPFTHWDARDLVETKREYDELAKFLPRNVEAEAALIGALLLDNRVIERVESTLLPEHFYDPMHARIYERILVLHGAGRSVTPITLRPYFVDEIYQAQDEHGRSVDMSLMSYIVELTGSGAGLIGASAFAEQIIDLSLLRSLVQAISEIGEEARDTEKSIDPRRVIEFAEAKLVDVATQIPERVKTGSYWGEASEEAIAQAEDRAGGGTATGVTIEGYDDWNTIVGPMGAGDAIYLGGRPSMGKTAVACAVAAGAALSGWGTDFLSLEMTREQLSRRINANIMFEQGVTSSYAEQQKGQFTRDDRAAMERMKAKIAGKPLYIDAPDEMMVEQLLPWLRMRKRIWSAKGVEQRLCVIDYLERFGTQKRFDREPDRVSYISRKVKDAAKMAGVAIVLLCQLSRGVESRDDKRPVLSDLRQSGNLEQDADTVVYVYRDEYYLLRSKPSDRDHKKFEAWEEDYRASRDRLELYTAKRREGALMKRTGYFFTNEQAIRSSDFYRGDFGMSDGQGGFAGWGEG